MERCSVRVGGEGYSANSSTQCPNQAKVIRDGNPYCGVHDPEAIRGRRKKRGEEADAKWAIEREAQRRKAVILNVGYGISTKVFDQKATEIREFLETLQKQIKH